jgi:hypothetical protein
VVHALKRSIPWEPAEPTDDALFSYLRALGFLPNDIASWFVLRLLPQWISRGEQQPFVEYIEPFLNAMAVDTKWTEVSFLPEALLAHAESVLKAPLNRHNDRRAFAYTDPQAVAARDNDYTIFNTISAAADVFRDRTMVTKTLTEVAKGKRVILICGVAHAVMQEPAHRQYFS